jgi:hypothetical protein
MANLSENSIRKACYRGGFADDKPLYIGTGNDVSLTWDGTDAHLSPAANNSVFNIGTGSLSFDINIYGSATTKLQSFDCSADKWVWGTTAAHISSATAGIIFDDRVHECSATSGSAYGFKQRMYITGAAGSGAAGRFYTLGYGVAVANGYGVEGTFEYHSPTTTVTGLAAAGKFNVIAGVDATGTAAVLDLSYDVASGKTVQTNGSAYIRVGKTNSGTGSNVLFNFVDAAGAAGGVTSLVCTDHANDITANLFARCLVAGTPAWILMTTTAPAAS